MAEEQKGEVNPSAANLGEPGVKPPEGVPLKGTPAAEGNQEAEGLKAAAVAEREKRQAAEAKAEATKAENQTLRDQMSIINAQQTQQQTQQPQKQTSLSEAVAKRLGIDMDLATPQEICQINEGVLQIMSGQQSEQSFIASHSDYAEVVGVTLPGGQFQLAAPLSRQIKANPALSNALQNSPNKAVLAYAIASQDSQYLTELKEAAKSDDTKAAEKAEAAIKAANQQLSIGAAKGGGNLDQTAALKAMSDEEFKAHNEQIMAKAT